MLLLDKSAFCGGNSTKATSGINAAGTSSQRALGIQDDPETFFKDTEFSAAETARPELIKVLTYESGPALEWLKDFGLDLSIVARLAAHSNPRTHRGKERFPGMAITYGLMEAYEAVCDLKDGRATLVNKAEVTELISEGETVVGVKYSKAGKTYSARGPVVLATGGFGADFTDNSLLAQVTKEFAAMPAWTGQSRAGQQAGGKAIPMPDLRSLPTTNGPHCTGDGIRLGMSVGAGTTDLHCVQIHPTGIVDPSEPDAKVKFLAAEALRGSGGVVLDRDGNRFCDELGKRDYVSGRMLVHDKGPYRLCLNSHASKLIAWHCEHYSARGLMKSMTGKELAAEMGCQPAALQKTFDEYNKAAQNPGTDKWGCKFFEAAPLSVDDNTWHVAQIQPLIHYCMGGLAINPESAVITPAGKPIEGLFCAGEVMGGVHGQNRLGGSSLLDCVAYGRVSGRSAAKYLLESLIANPAAAATGGAGGLVNLTVDPSSKSVTINFGAGASGAGASAGDVPPTDSGTGEVDENQAFYGTGDGEGKGAAAPASASFTMEEVAKHTTKDDCWVVLDGSVYAISPFLDDHPGGAKAIMLYAGKDATEPFDMLHSRDVLTKYASEFLVGTVAQTAKL